MVVSSLKVSGLNASQMLVVASCKHKEREEQDTETHKLAAIAVGGYFCTKFVRGEDRREQDTLLTPGNYQLTNHHPAEIAEIYSQFAS